MLNFIKEKKNCTGCAACYNICPIGCISMLEDEEGFLYPSADERCIHCNKCITVCPIFNNKIEKKLEIEQYGVAAISNDNSVWNASSSGGAFSEICNVFGDNDTVIFGAAFEELKVKHLWVTGVENIDIFRKSKYVQSDLSNNFKQAEDFLRQGRKVIFSGTPCQIAGLKSYLKQEYDNLLCIDLICHGVGSPKVFKASLSYMETRYNAKITKYTFRYKKVKFGNFREYMSQYVFDDYKEFLVDKDVYNQLFLAQLCLRPSCQSNCYFRTVNRISDITIADFKNKIKIFPRLNDFRNYSTIIVNSEKGDAVLKKLYTKMSILPCRLTDIIAYNPLFCKNTVDNKMRNLFFTDFIAGLEINFLIKKYLGRVKEDKFVFLKSLIPYRFKFLALKIISIMHDERT
ncbi:MAG: Coenzyme F420 hydrogenase/dehydrogenase, beta subunit C-terminal domain [Acidaminococcaceae bacterium]